LDGDAALLLNNSSNILTLDSLSDPVLSSTQCIGSIRSLLHVVFHMLSKQLSTGPDHCSTMISYCIPCDRSFISPGALLQHKRDSPLHGHDCRMCDKHFGSERALKQHLQHSPIHTKTRSNEVCQQSFVNRDDLKQCIQESTSHTVTFDDSDRSYSSNKSQTLYNGISPELIKPVYKTALLLRRTKASVQDIVL
jgi:hypothetical protein